MAQRINRTFLIVHEFPDLAAEVRDRLTDLSEHHLAAQLNELRIRSRCGCGDDFCAMMFSLPEPPAGYSDLRNVDLEVDEGFIILDVVENRIASIEVLYRDAVRQKLHELLP